MNTYVHSAHGHCEHGHIQSVLASSTHGAERMCDCMRRSRGEHVRSVMCGGRMQCERVRERARAL